MSIDAVVADFISGAVEWLAPANDPDHWDLIEGQGSLFHPSYAGVTLGLLARRPARRAGDVPRADPRPHARPAGYKLPVLEALLDLILASARASTNPEVRVIGVCLQHLGAGPEARARSTTSPAEARSACRRSTRSAPASRASSTGWPEPRCAVARSRPESLAARAASSPSPAAPHRRRGCVIVDRRATARRRPRRVRALRPLRREPSRASSGADRRAWPPRLRPRRAADAAAARRGAQRGRLRAVGPGGQAQRPPRLASWPASPSRGR